MVWCGARVCTRVLAMVCVVVGFGFELGLELELGLGLVSVCAYVCVADEDGVYGGG